MIVLTSKDKKTELITFDNKETHKFALFKSTPENYWKEYSGNKSNTFRKIDNDSRFDEDVDAIKITNTKTGYCFTRLLTDKTDFEGYRIFSWRTN